MTGMIRNYWTDPTCQKPHVSYRTVASKQDNGLYTYTLQSGYDWGTIFAPPKMMQEVSGRTAYLMYMEYTLGEGDITLEAYNGRILEQDDTHIIIEKPAPNQWTVMLLALRGTAGVAQITPSKCGYFWSEDYELLKSGYDLQWFDGRTMPMDGAWPTT